MPTRLLRVGKIAQHPRENGPAWRVILPTLPAFDNFKQAILQKLLLEIG
jgi:hypothetical protein